MYNPIPSPTEAAQYVYNRQQALIDTYVNSIVDSIVNNCISNRIVYEVPKPISSDIITIFRKNNYTVQLDVSTSTGQYDYIIITW